MQLDNQIYFWAHMLDESFINDFNIKMPKNENEKFKYCEVFTDEVCFTFDTDHINDFLCKIWPNWEKYFKDSIAEVIEVKGERTDVDDWDEWKISIEDLNNGYDNCKSLLFEKLLEQFPCNYVGSLKDMIDFCVDELAESEYDMRTLNKYGQLLHKGHHRTGGYYPDY